MIKDLEDFNYAKEIYLPKTIPLKFPQNDILPIKLSPKNNLLM